MSFAEINDLENGQAIPALQGTIKKVFDQKTGVGDYGPWNLQHLILQDEHANELEVTWSCPNPWEPKDEGKHLLFESGRDRKDQLVGIKREIRNKKDKEGNVKRYESVKVDDRAKVITGTEQRDNRSADIMDKGLHGGVDPNWPDVEKPRPSMLDERQRAIIRQHSQSMAIEVLKLKQMLGEITIEDLTPAKLRILADYFDNDVIGATQ